MMEQKEMRNHFESCQ